MQIHTFKYPFYEWNKHCHVNNINESDAIFVLKVKTDVEGDSRLNVSVYL